jgi:prevent-host-death family protein
MRSVTAREANRAFSRILKEAEGGEPVVITRRGQPVAIIAPYRAADAQERKHVIEHIVALMRRGLPIGGKRFSRDEMHERRSASTPLCG